MEPPRSHGTSRASAGGMTSVAAVMLIRGLFTVKREQP